MIKLRNRFSPDRAGVTALFAALLGIAGAAEPVAAEEPSPAPPASSGWQFNVALFGWMPSITGSATIRGNSFDDNASFGDLVRKSDSVLAFDAHVEAQKDKFGVFLEPIWMDLGFGSPRDILFTELKAQITYVEFGGFYRAFEGVAGPANHHWAVDVLAGGRYTNLGARITLSSSLGSSTMSQYKNWVDPFIGARARIEMTPGWDFNLRGDIGGFGVGSLFSWNLVTFISHDFSLFGSRAFALAGFKALYQDYRTGSGNTAFRWDNILWGPVIGIGVNF